MKKKEYLKELRELTEEGLKERLLGLSEEQMKLRFRKASGQLDQSHRLAEVRTQIARIQTVYGEKFRRAEVA
ncbi:50S ribosomal protein L29 [bacterium]|nr:50S ribosomal protein L29 [bacterium]